MIDKLKSFFGFIDTWKFFVPLIAAIVMYFTPDSVDRVIRSALNVFGLKEYVIQEVVKDEQNK